MILVILDFLEKLYLAGFPLLLVFVTVFPMVTRQSVMKVETCMPSGGLSCPETKNQAETVGSAMEFLPLMLTSVYCAIGLVWGFLRLTFIYLNEETTYQGQLSSLR